MARINKKSNLVEQEKQREDLGFGTKVTSKNARLVKSNGDFNVIKLGQSFEARLNLYHRLITMNYKWFIVGILSFYFMINLLFGSIYYLIGMEHLGGIAATDELSAFSEAFFFSSQTLTTVGYGRVSPIGYFSNVVAAIEALIGLLAFAILTGLLYGRFAKPNLKILYSNNALISPYLDTNGFMLRMANEKNNQLINMSASIIFSRNEKKNGEERRQYYNLELERSKVKFFSMSWTLVHPIIESSPLFGETKESLMASDAEFLVSIEAINDTNADPVHSRKSYLYDELIWGAKFESMSEPIDDAYVMDLLKISDYKNVELNSI